MGTVVAAEAEVEDVEAQAVVGVVDVEAVVVIAVSQEQIVSALVVVAQEQTRKRLLIKVSSLEIHQVLYFLKTCHIV